MFNMMKMLLLCRGRRQGPDPSATSSFADGSLSGHVFALMGTQVRGQGLARYGGDILALPPMAGENTESPALLLSSLSFIWSQDFNCKKDKRKRQPSTLSLLSLQRYETSFFMVCCKNRAFFFKLILPQRLLRNYFEYI